MARILIVDDNQAIVEALSILVGARGHESIPAHSGEEALEMMASEMPDVVLLDINMPGIDGFETLERLREMTEGKNVAVLFVTARDDDDLEDLVHKAGGNGLLAKPVDAQLLAEKIEAHTAALAN